MIEAALRTDVGALPAWVGVDVGNLGYAVVKVTKAVPREAVDEATMKQDRARYSQWWTQAESLAYYNLLKERFKTQVKVTKPVTKPEDEAQALQTQ